MTKDGTTQAQKDTPIKPQQKLTVKQRKFVANKIKGKTNLAAYIDAGYKASSAEVGNVNASRLLKKDSVQHAIDKALEFHGATAEYAVGVIKQVADQEEEIGARRLAAKDLLELHGWRKTDKASITVDVQNGFFSTSRNIEEATVIDVDSH